MAALDVGHLFDGVPDGRARNRSAVLAQVAFEARRIHLPRFTNGSGLVHGPEEPEVIRAHEEEVVAEEPDLEARGKVRG